MKKKVLISACLLGKACRYNGKNSFLKELENIAVDWVSVCPEESGGLGTPRSPAEIQGDTEKIINNESFILNNKGIDVTSNFIEGAKISLKEGLKEGVEIAILKSKSPSCGIEKIYDGSFSGVLKKGNGFFAHLCQKNGIDCISSDNISQIKKIIEEYK